MHCNRTRSLPPRTFASPSVSSRPPPRTGDERALDLVDHVPDEVRDVQRLAGRRAHLREHDEAVAVLVGDRREQQEVGEREVGEQPPREGQALQMRERVALHRGVDERELLEGRHLAPGYRGSTRRLAVHGQGPPRRELPRLWTASTVSNLGDGVTLAALPHARRGAHPGPPEPDRQRARSLLRAWSTSPCSRLRTVGWTRPGSSPRVRGPPPGVVLFSARAQGSYRRVGLGLTPFGALLGGVLARASAPGAVHRRRHRDHHRRHRDDPVG